MAPAAKKRKTDSAAAEKYPCFTCATDRVSKQFPDYNPSPDCDHLINTCKTCLKKWVESNVQSTTFTTGGEDGKVFGVKCPHPQCEGVMRNVNIEMAVSKRVYLRFEELGRKHIGDTTPGWRWCLAPGCRAGQVHESKVPVRPPRSKRKSLRDRLFADQAPAEPDICTCNTCGSKACVPCDRPWHDGETCAEYQARLKDRMAEEDKALKTIGQVTKECPGCKKRIQKNGGCPSMLCSQCRTNFCWNCGAVFTAQGCGCSRR